MEAIPSAVFRRNGDLTKNTQILCQNSKYAAPHELSLEELLKLFSEYQ